MTPPLDLPAILDALLMSLDVTPGPPDAELGLKSIQVITLVDLLEDRFEDQFDSVMFGAADVTRAHFATRADLLALLRAKGLP